MKCGFGFFVAAVLFFFGGLFFWGFRSCEQKPLNVLKVALIQGRPLGSSSDLHEGFDWDVAFQVAIKMHKVLETKAIWVSDFKSALFEGDVDLVSASMNITDERLNEMAMVHVYGKPLPYVTLIFWEPSYKSSVGGNISLRGMGDFFDKHAVGVVKGSGWESLLKMYEIKNIKTYAHEHNLVFGLQQGEVGTIVVGLVSADLLQKQNSNVWTLKASLDKPYSYGIGLAIKKERSDLIKQVADAVKELQGEGVIDMLQIKWFGKVY